MQQVINFLKSDSLSNFKDETEDLLSTGFIFSATVFNGDWNIIRNYSEKILRSEAL